MISREGCGPRHVARVILRLRASSYRPPARTRALPSRFRMGNRRAAARSLRITVATIPTWDCQETSRGSTAERWAERRLCDSQDLPAKRTNTRSTPPPRLVRSSPLQTRNVPVVSRPPGGPPWGPQCRREVRQFRRELFSHCAIPIPPGYQTLSLSETENVHGAHEPLN